MKKVHIISRHTATTEWIKERIKEIAGAGFEVAEVKHLNSIEVVNKGDIVVGMLPINIVAEICTKGATFYAFLIDTPPHFRGVELIAEQLSECNPRLEHYVAKKQMMSRPIEATQLREVLKRLRVKWICRHVGLSEHTVRCFLDPSKQLANKKAYSKETHQRLSNFAEGLSIIDR